VLRWRAAPCSVSVMKLSAGFMAEVITARRETIQGAPKAHVIDSDDRIFNYFAGHS